MNFSNYPDNHKMTKDLDYYERFNLKIDSMGVQYYKKERCSQVLEEVTLNLDVGVINKLKAAILLGDANQDEDNAGKQEEAEVIV